MKAVKAGGLGNQYVIHGHTFFYFYLPLSKYKQSTRQIQVNTRQIQVKYVHGLPSGYPAHLLGTIGVDVNTDA